MPAKFRMSRRWITVLSVAAFLFVVWMFLGLKSEEPRYQGRRLGSWLRGHPKEYYPAVLALGTNALPYLLAELQATDSRASQWGQGVLAKASIGPLWSTARDRRYRAGIGLQILDTNAVPALLEMIFSKPMKMVEGDSGYSAASTLSFIASEAAKNQVADRLASALDSSTTVERRNACLTLSLWPQTNDHFAVSLAALSRDGNPTIRAAALRAMMMCKWREDLFPHAVTVRLEDEQASVRMVAILILTIQGSNVVGALPALRKAYSNELNQPNLRGALGDNSWGTHSWSAQDVRSTIRDAIKRIDPSAPPPVDPP